MNETRNRADEVHEKYETQFAILAFVALGFALQTGTDHEWALAALFELVGWICLLAAGIIALERLRTLAPILSNHAKAAHAQSQADRIGARDAASIEGDAELVRTYMVGNDGAEAFRSQARAATEALWRRFEWQRRTLYAGFAALAVARAWEPTCKLVDAWTPLRCLLPLS